jgi:putative peptidoglycan lipid II flippase
VVLPPVRASGFDVLEGLQQDPGDENSVTAPAAIDGNPATAWSTQYYLGSPACGGLKKGAGLIVDMGRVVRISSVTVTLGPEPGAAVSLEIGDRDTLTAATLATVAPWPGPTTSAASIPSGSSIRPGAVTC